MQSKHPTPSAVPPEGVIACEVCLTEIPSSVAKSHGGEEYVHYFCGEHCYVQWKEQEQEAAKRARDQLEQHLAAATARIGEIDGQRAQVKSDLEAALDVALTPASLARSA